MLTGLVIAFGAAEAYWHFYEAPRRRQRDEYYKNMGVEWKHLV
jgi:peptidoglycan/LPS O-acetylase OafA/YrhL